MHMLLIVDAFHRWKKKNVFSPCPPVPITTKKSSYRASWSVGCPRGGERANTGLKSKGDDGDDSLLLLLPDDDDDDEDDGFSFEEAAATARPPRLLMPLRAALQGCGEASVVALQSDIAGEAMFCFFGEGSIKRRYRFRLMGARDSF